MTKQLSEDQRQRWKEIILKQKDSGLSIERYCRFCHKHSPLVFPKECHSF